MDPIELQELLDALADGSNLTDLLRQYSDEGRLTIAEADRLEAEAREAFTRLNGDAPSEADIAQMTVLADAVDAVRAERGHLVEAAAEQAERVAEIAARIAPPADEASEDGDEDGAEGNDSEDGDSDDVDVANAEVVDTTGDAAAEVVAEAEAATEDAATVTAGGTPNPRPRVNLAQIARRSPRPDASIIKRDNGLPFGGSLVASAEAPGVRGGSNFESWLDIAQVAQRAFGTSPSSLLASVQQAERAGNTFYQRNGLLEMRMQFPEHLIWDGTGDATDFLANAVNQSNLPGGSLLAAGGWCSPSEQLYDLCDLPCTYDGILSLPEVLASRGGLKWIKSLDWCQIFNAPGFFHFTEAEMQAEPRPEKPCMEIPCPEEDECRLDVDGLCITADIMMRRTFPELIAQFIQGALCAHAHRINANKINQIVAGSPSIGTITQAGYGATNSILYAIEMQIQAYRYRGRRAQDGNPALLELVAPYWIKAVVRADIANRNAPSGIGNPMSVSDAEIVQWFATRGVAVRFVYDWQDLTNCPVPPATTVPPVTDYPNQVEFILYEAGTWVVPSLDVITLDTLYDSQLIKQNKYQALFTEQAFCVINRCNDSIRFTVPICANGNTGAQVAVACA